MEKIVLLQIFIMFSLAFVYFFAFRVKTYSVKEVEDRSASFVFSKPLRNFAFWLVEPILKLAVFLKISPNMLTSLSCVISAISATLFATGSISWGAWVLAFASACDALDGRLARRMGEASKRGEFLDSSLDRISDALIFFGILFYYRHDVYMFFVVALLIASAMNVSYFRVKAESLGAPNGSGLMQRPERFLVLGSFGVLSPYISYIIVKLGFDVGPALVFKAAIIFLAFATFGTSIQRLIDGYKRV